MGGTDSVLPEMEMHSLTCASLFTGGGLADIGMAAAGFRPLWGIELNPEIARVAGPHVLAQDVLSTDWRSLPTVDLLWASPPCPNFSTAGYGKEQERDIEFARAILNCVQTLNIPRLVVENVPRYRRSQSYAVLQQGLQHWHTTASIMDAYNLGVPQNRRRFILRATHPDLEPPRPIPTSKGPGWYSAIADLSLPTFSPSPKQTQLILSLPPHQGPWLIERQGCRSDRPPLSRTPTQPIWTIRASLGKWSKAFHIVYTEHSIHALSIQAMARLQTLPDSFPLPPSHTLALQIIGNGVPCNMAFSISQSMK